MTTVAIIGAGRVGQTLARLALAAGYDVSLSGSGAAIRTKRIAETFAPGATARTTADAVTAVDIIILALPLGAVLEDLDPDPFDGHIVVDATNYWPETDGERPEWDDEATPTSVLVQRRLAGSTVVKALGHVAYRDLAARSRPPGAAHRIGIGISGDDAEALARVSTVVDALGFDPVRVGPLAASGVLGPRGPVFGAVVPARELQARTQTPAGP